MYLVQFGFFCYAVQSFASQILQQPRLFILSGVHPWAAATHTEMLRLAGRCFTEALGQVGTKHSEPWIYHWMLGKIGCKLGEPVKSVMTHLLKVTATLCGECTICTVCGRGVLPRNLSGGLVDQSMLVVL